MAYWEWTETYLTNISNLDDHHHKLVALLNELHDNVYECQNLSQKQPLIGQALAELIDYSCYHFQAEEELMLTYEYPGYVHHKEEYEQFKLQITQLMEQHKVGNLALSFPIIGFIKEWISSHVLKTDKQYGAYLNEKVKE